MLLGLLLFSAVMGMFQDNLLIGMFQDNLQNRVFQEKRQLCSRVREFSNKYGLLATMKKPSDLALQHKRWLNTIEGSYCTYICVGFK